MKIVIYACIPVPASNGLFRRVRIVIDGAKATSVEPFGASGDHNSCYHMATVHEYMDEGPDPLVLRPLREHFNGVGYSPSSFVEECPL